MEPQSFPDTKKFIMNMLKKHYILSYDVLESCIPINECDKYHIFINVGDMLDSIEFINYKEREKTESEFQNITIFVAISILNIIAHYRHFYISRRNTKNIIFLYCNNTEQYEKHSKVLEHFNKFSMIIPKLYVVPFIGQNDEAFYHYLKNTLILKMINSSSTDKRCIIHIITQSKIDYISNEIDENIKIFTKIGNGLCFMNFPDIIDTFILRHSRALFQNPKFVPWLKLMLPQMLALSGGIFDWKFIDEYKKLTANKRLSIFEKYIKKLVYGKEKIPSTSEDIMKLDKNFINECFFEPNTINTFMNRISLIRYQQHPEVLPIVDKMVESMLNKKSKDSNISSINDMSNIFKDHPLKIEWLYQVL